MHIISPHEATRQATEIMVGYAERTGLLGTRRALRSLWPDALALFNLLELARRTHDSDLLDLARRLVSQVHEILGAFRPDDIRKGFLSGPPQYTPTRLHPTLGGLRMGADLPERAAEDSFDPALEPERDGQYFRDLMRWTRALRLMAEHTGDDCYQAWAVELADTTHRAFTYYSADDRKRRMFLKMSTDLTRPLIPSMGQYDPLDGWLTCEELKYTASSEVELPAVWPSLHEASLDFAALLAKSPLHTVNPVGIGELLVNACRLAQLMQAKQSNDIALLRALLGSAADGLTICLQTAQIDQSDATRVAHRELSLSIGLSAVSWLNADPARMPVDREAQLLLTRLSRYIPFGTDLRAFWLAPEVSRSLQWASRRNLSEVMLASSLIPEGILVSPLRAAKGDLRACS